MNLHRSAKFVALFVAPVLALTSEILANTTVQQKLSQEPSDTRGSLARALFNKPALFIADEPTGNLDEETANAVADLIFALPKELGTTVVVVTHDTEISKRADSCVQLSQGKLTDATA